MSTYVGDRRVLDADSHVMELADFLDPFLEESQRDLLRDPDALGLTPAVEDGWSKFLARQSDLEEASRAKEHLLEVKGWRALGAFDPAERSEVLDLLGVAGQLVFATFSGARYLGRDPERLYAGSSAQNRALVEFCRHDPRLHAVAFVPLVDPARALALATEAIDAGCAAIMVPSTAAGERAPTHPDLFGFWQLLNDRGVPFVLHVGGGGRLLDPAFHNNDMPVTDHLGGGENVRSKDFLAIADSPALFLGVLIYDGLFDRFPALRGGCIEQGAGWVVSWMRHLDYGLRAFRRTEEPLRRLEHAPSEYVRRHLKFTPFPGEDVGWMIKEAGSELFMFSTDYPHPEGGKDPLAKFEEALGAASAGDRDRFYFTNLAELLGVTAEAV